MAYTYNLNPTQKVVIHTTYRYEELAPLTTIELREICHKEKIVIGAAFKLNRDYMIDRILKYRGERLFTFVNTYLPERFTDVLKNFKSMLVLSDAAHNSVYLPTKITIYKDLDITPRDKYILKGERLFNGNAFLLDAHRNPIGIVNIKKIDGEFHLLLNRQLIMPGLETALNKNFSIGFLDDKGSKYLYNYYYQLGRTLPTKLHCYTLPISELLISNIEEANTPLVIDFGTSNTSVGAYIDEHFLKSHIKLDLTKNGLAINDINKVHFIDTLPKEAEVNEIVPTVISVLDCSDENNIRYRYGYNALKHAKRNSYNNPASVFYGIKKWINNYEIAEEVADEKGNKAVVKRRDILKAYFDYLIQTANEQHKCIYRKLHITSPVKQKQQFLNMYKSVLSNYEVITETALDEGIAVLYNTIATQIENQSFGDSEKLQALIIDCGGGTTDLTSCAYKIANDGVTYQLNIETTYSNGETSFGGNNITYRIFQFLKIIFAQYYNEQPLTTISDIFGDSSADIYRYVDQNGIEQIYEKLETAYHTYEKVIPTRYDDYKNSPSEDYMKIRSNFYFLWNLAEKIKIDFFKSLSLTQTTFHQQGLKVDGVAKKITSEEAWRLNIYKDIKRHDRGRNIIREERELVLETVLPNIVLSKEEIETLIKADIYYVIKKFLEPMYVSGKIEDFSLIKLTGQTCKIDIFRDALKEFIAGRVISSSKKDKSVKDFKLTCLEGAIKYQNAKKIGKISPTIENKSPVTPYSLLGYSHTGSPVKLVDSLDRLDAMGGYIERTIDTEILELTLQDSDRNTIHKYPVFMNHKQFKKTDYLDTDLKARVNQSSVDDILDGQIRIFAYSSPDKWGFHVLCVARKDGALIVNEEIYLPFENDEWELNFFDGRK